MDDEADNPFRPGSELSREADIIVNLIKEGKPITPTREMDSDITNGSLTKMKQAQTESSPVTNVNGSPVKVAEPGVVEVQHGIIVPPNDKSQVVEQVNLKKKRKCCTIQ